MKVDSVSTLVHEPVAVSPSVCADDLRLILKRLGSVLADCCHLPSSPLGPLEPALELDIQSAI